MATRKTPAKRSRGKAETRAERNIRWIEEWCRAPEGKLQGQPIRLRDWQKDDLRKIYDNPHGTRLAIISFGKKNGKTSLAACLLLLHLCGPEAVPNSQLPSTAQSRDQAAVLFGLAAKMVRYNSKLDAQKGGVITIRDTAKQLYCQELGTLYKALSAEASTAHGQSPIFAVHDELGQVRGPRSELFNAIENAMGAHEAPMSIVISTQAPNDGDLLSILIDDAIRNEDPTVVLSLYTADPEIDPFSEEALRQANPAYGDFLNPKEVKRQAENARRLPADEPLYRNYTLNQRVEMQSPFISKSVWRSCGVEVIEDFAGLPVFGGLDLSATSDLTALVLIAPVNDDGETIWHVKPTFWLPGEGLAEKAHTDREIYDVWHKQGFLETTPGRSIQYEYVAGLLWERFSDLDIRSIAFDRYNWKYLKPWLSKAGFTEDQLEGDAAIFKKMGQGYASMSPALRTLEGDLLERRIAHGNHPVLAMCAGNAVVTSDPAGNRKLDKDKSTRRIDGLVALAMARAMAGTYEEAEPFDAESWIASYA